MHSQNPFLDEFAKLTQAATGIAQTAGEEAKTAMRAQADRLAAEFDLIRRDDFEALKAEVAALRAEVAELKAEKAPAKKTAAGSETRPNRRVSFPFSVKAVVTPPAKQIRVPEVGDLVGSHDPSLPGGRRFLWTPNRKKTTSCWRWTPLRSSSTSLAAENLTFDRTEDGDLAFALTGDWKDYELWFAWRPEADCLQLCLSLDLRASKTKRPAAYELLSMINQRVWLGHFEVWTDDGEVVFRHALALPAGERPTMAQAASMIDAAVEAADRFYPAFDFLLHGAKTPDEAMAACMFETVGQA